VEIVRDGRVVQRWKGAEELERELTSDMVLARQKISVEEWAQMNIANYNAESHRMLAEAVKQADERQDTVERVRRDPQYYPEPYTDGFTEENTVVISRKKTRDDAKSRQRRIEKVISIIRDKDKSNAESKKGRSEDERIKELAEQYLLYHEALQQSKAKGDAGEEGRGKNNNKADE